MKFRTTTKKAFELKSLKNISKLRKFSKWRLNSNLSTCSSFNFSTNSNNNFDFYRRWLKIDNYSRNVQDLRIMSYNILADSYAYDYLFPACSKQDKSFEFRSKLLQKFLISFIVCKKKIF